MSYLTTHRNSNNAPCTALTDEELASRAPAIFARHAADNTSSKYLFVPTVDVLNQMREAGWLPVAAKQQVARVREGFQRHSIRFARAEKMSFVGEVRPEVVLYNSHDAGSAYQLHVGLLRLVCLNGLVVSDGTFQHVAVRHSGQQAARVVEASLKAVAALPDVLARIQQWRAIELSEGERFEFARAALLLRWDSEAEAPVRPEKLLVPKRAADYGKDLWRTLNTVQEQLIRGGQRDYSRRRDDGSRIGRVRAVKSIQEDLKLNKGIWQLAETLAAQRPGLN
jgi:hypothetical protein